MFSDIPAFRDELKARLVAALPADWSILEDIDARNASLVPAVYLEFVGLDSTFQGTPLPHGVLASETNVVITDPKTNEAGEASVEEHVVDVIGALDPHEDLAWSTARKIKVESSGAWSWVLTVFAFVAVPTI